MIILFWICWAAEFIISLWWVISETKYAHLSLNPFSIGSVLLLLLVLLIRIFGNAVAVTNALVFIPAIPLAGMGLIYLIMVFGKGRMN